jgi:hypothetical protein
VAKLGNPRISFELLSLGGAGRYLDYHSAFPELARWIVGGWAVDTEWLKMNSWTTIHWYRRRNVPVASSSFPESMRWPEDLRVEFAFPLCGEIVTTNFDGEPMAKMTELWTSV